MTVFIIGDKWDSRWKVTRVQLCASMVVFDSITYKNSAIFATNNGLYIVCNGVVERIIA